MQDVEYGNYQSPDGPILSKNEYEKLHPMKLVDQYQDINGFTVRVYVNHRRDQQYQSYLVSDPVYPGIRYLEPPTSFTFPCTWGDS